MVYYGKLNYGATPLHTLPLLVYVDWTNKSRRFFNIAIFFFQYPKIYEVVCLLCIVPIIIIVRFLRLQYVFLAFDAFFFTRMFL